MEAMDSDPVLDKLKQIQEICKRLSPPSPKSVASALPKSTLDAISSLVGNVDNRSFDFQCRFSDIRKNAASSGDKEAEAELLNTVTILECISESPYAPEAVSRAMTGVVEGMCKLAKRNAIYIRGLETVDDIIEALKLKLSAAESSANTLQRDKNNLIDEYAALGALHQQIKNDALNVETHLNMTISDLNRRLEIAMKENSDLLETNSKLTADSANLCATLESRAEQQVDAMACPSEAAQDNEELTTLRSKLVELTVERDNCAQMYSSAGEALTVANAEISTCKAELAQAVRQVQKLERDLLTAREELSSVREEKDNAMQEYAKLASGIQKTASESDNRQHELLVRIKELEGTISKLREQSALEVELELKNGELAELTAQLVERSSELLKSRHDLQVVEQQLSETRGDLHELQTEFNVIKQTLKEEAIYSEKKLAEEVSKVSDLTLRLCDVESNGDAALKESQQKVSELSKTCQSLQAKIKDLTVGSSSVALHEAFSSLDQTADLEEVAAWLKKQMDEIPESSSDGSGGERGALRSKLLEIHASNESARKKISIELKRLSKVEVTLQRNLDEARSLVDESEGIIQILKTEKAHLQKKVEDLERNQQSGGSSSSRLKSDGRTHEKSEYDSPSRSLLMSESDHNLSFHEPIIYVEIGNFECRVGVWVPSDGLFSQRFRCPAIVAGPKNVSILPEDLIRGASLQSSAMYRVFRETGYFIGQDAQYCAYDHPDAALRGSLEVKRVVADDGTIKDADAYSALFKYCVSQAFAIAEANAVSPAIEGNFQVVFPFKPTFGRLEKNIFGALFFENGFSVLGSDAGFDADAAVCEKAYIVSENFMTTLLQGMTSAVVVDIGSRSTRVVPVYEGVAINRSMRMAMLGGEHCTDAMEKLLDAKSLSSFSSNLPRRRKQIARAFKERHGFVASSFEEAVAAYGSFSYEAVRVMLDAKEELPEVLGALLSNSGSNESSKGKAIEEITVRDTIKQNDGTVDDIVLHRERFYCTEVLFGKASESEGPQGAHVEETIIDAILSSVMSIDDEDMRVEICANIVLTGGSAAFPGLIARLKSNLDLQRGLNVAGIINFDVHVAEVSGNVKDSVSRFYSSAMEGTEIRLTRLQNLVHSMEGGCITSGDFQRMGADCFDNFV